LAESGASNQRTCFLDGRNDDARLGPMVAAWSFASNAESNTLKAPRGVKPLSVANVVQDSLFPSTQPFICEHTCQRRHASLFSSAIWAEHLLMQRSDVFEHFGPIWEQPVPRFVLHFSRFKIGKTVVMDTRLTLTPTCCRCRVARAEVRARRPGLVGLGH
jgi:hypothetical protein